MIELISNYTEPILAFLTGGGLLSFVTLKFTRKQAEADAMKDVQDVYQETIKDLREDKDRLGDELKTLRDEVADIYKQLRELRQYKCIVIDCKMRKTE